MNIQMEKYSVFSASMATGKTLHYISLRSQRRDRKLKRSGETGDRVAKRGQFAIIGSSGDFAKLERV